MEVIFSAILMVIMIAVAIYKTTKNMGIDEMLGVMHQELNNTNINRIKENSYMDYTKFFGTESLSDKEFIKKMKIIYSQIMKDKTNC